MSTMPNFMDVDLGKGYDPWGSARRFTAPETIDLQGLENQLLAEVQMRLSHTGQPTVPYWPILNDVSRQHGRQHRYQSRSFRRVLIPLFWRLVKEKRLIRHKAAGTVELGPNFHRATYPDVDTRPDSVGPPSLD